MKCPHCNCNIDVQLIKAPADMQAANEYGKEQKERRDADVADLEELLDMIDVSTLKGQSLDFVVETRERFRKYKDKTRMSDKQMAWLRKIANPEAEEWS